MTGGDQREPLWATSLTDEPQHDYDALFPEEEAGPPPPPPKARRPVRLRRVVLAGIVVLALALVFDGGWLAVEDLPSSWDDTAMTCRTARFERGDQAFELFSCRANGNGSLPPGLYLSPDAQWASDVTRRDALANVIEISPEGELTGWAAYG